MSKVLICSSVEPGIDGVGDYSRRLAGELIRRGERIAIVALNDRAVKTSLDTFQDAEGTQVRVLRLPAEWPLSRRIAVAREWICNFNPEWISLQFVPYGFQKKGLPFGLGPKLSTLHPTAKWHVMFHELWIGENLGASLKHRIIGFLQRQIVKEVFRSLTPHKSFTSTEVYRRMLRGLGRESELVPIFSNIPVNSENTPVPDLLPFDLQIWQRQRSKLLVGLLFGSVNPGWRAIELMKLLELKAREAKKTLLVVSAGNDGFTISQWKRFSAEQFENTPMVRLGRVTSESASNLMKWADFGFLTTPAELLGKSGVCAAFRAHGLPVLINRDDWKTRFGVTIELKYPLVDCLFGISKNFQFTESDRNNSLSDSDPLIFAATAYQSI
jgi:hypothetical protein